MKDFFDKHISTYKSDMLSGITVALALVPEAIAFAFVAGVAPLVGLYAAFMIGLITAVLGGRPGMISGATGALAVVMVSLVQEGNTIGIEQGLGEGLGLYYLFATIILMGLLQIIAGALKLGKFVRLIPHPVMMGFVNGLAIVIFLSQLNMFKHIVGGQEVWLSGPALYLTIGLVLLTMFIMYFLPKITTKIPGALAAIVIVSGIVIISQLDVATVGSFVRSKGDLDGLKGGLPKFQTDLFTRLPFNWASLKFIFPYASILAAIGLIESLMTLNLIDEITDTHGNANRECLAQGLANVCTGFFGGMGGCAMIGQSLINIKSGGRRRLSGIVAACMLLMFILFGSFLIEQIPIAALVGVMFMVVIGTFAWSSFRLLNKIPLSDAFVLILVSTVTVFYDLAIAVITGVIVSALVFAWENAKRIRARKSIKEDGTKVYQIWGPLFFGSITDFNKKFDVHTDPSHIEIDFIESRVNDHSGIEAIQNLVNKYEKAGKKVVLKHLSKDCKNRLTKANPQLEKIVKEDIDDPRYYVMEDTAAMV